MNPHARRISIGRRCGPPASSYDSVFEATSPGAVCQFSSQPSVCAIASRTFAPQNSRATNPEFDIFVTNGFVKASGESTGFCFEIATICNNA